jgi:hypothetical protein
VGTALRYDIIALGIVVAGLLWAIHRRDRARIKATRGAYFEACRRLFEQASIAQVDVGFPVLEGSFRGHRIRLEPIVDHIAVRKLPSLWLKVDVFGELPIGGTLDFLARPLNTEFFSPSDGLPITLPIPPGWPQFALLRTDIPDRAVPVEALTPHMRIFADLKMKELLITPRGVRLVYQADQAERAHYMVLRQARFETEQLPADLAEALLERALSIYNTVASLQ